MAVGLPVVATDIGVLPELVGETTGGIRFPPADARALALATRRIAASPEEAHSLGARGRRTYMRRFSSDTNYGQLMDIYARARKA
jgi:glycosyltransferase involved in cell wall biosynthesis